MRRRESAAPRYWGRRGAGEGEGSPLAQQAGRRRLRAVTRSEATVR